MAADGKSLEVGHSRIGLMIDGHPETPPVAVKLERTERRVEVTIPFLDGHSDIYRYWFSDGIKFADDPDRTKRQYAPPESISFHDSRGSVGLVGSKVAGSKVNLGGTGTGEGRLTFDYAILGARSGADYESINGLRSEVEGLGTWVGLRALDVQPEMVDGRISAVDMRLESPPAIAVGRRLNAKLQPNWRLEAGPGPDQTTISERMQIHTHVMKSASWDDHFRVHLPLRELLRIASWRKLNFVSHEAMSVADNRWLPVITNRTGIAESATLLETAFLFTYVDVGSNGLARWLRLTRMFERGLSPLVGLLEVQGATLETHLALVGIGFEMLGYDLLIESGKSEKAAMAEHYIEKARAVVSAAADVLPFCAHSCAELLRDAYMGVKHPDRPQPDLLTMELAYLQAIQVFRAWVALRLGMPKTRLKAALERDPLTRHIRGIERSYPAG